MPRRVVYLKHTIPPSLPRFSLLPPLLHLFPSSSSASWRRGGRGRVKRERKKEGESSDNGETVREEGGVFEGQGGERRSTTTLGINPHHQPPLSPLAFASSIYGRMASRRRYAELTTFFRFSRRWGGVDRDSGWIEGKNGKRKAKAGRERQSSLTVERERERERER